MSDVTYKIGKGRGTKTVQARQYVKDQDFSLATWVNARVYRDHFRIGGDEDEVRAQKGDWIIKYEDGTVRVLDARTFASTARAQINEGEDA